MEKWANMRSYEGASLSCCCGWIVKDYSTITGPVSRPLCPSWGDDDVEMTTEAMALQTLGAHNTLVVRLKEIVAMGERKPSRIVERLLQ